MSSRVVVAGGAGFLGSHLCERLVAEGRHVLCLDSLLTGAKENLEAFENEPRFEFRETNITEYVTVSGAVDWILHFASPASPVDYLEHPIHTLKVGALGTLNLLGVAKEKGARFLLASTSEVYGDPKVHPQPESYWGNVNPVGPRGCYDEAKRFAEAMAVAYHRAHGIPIRIARIFNSYGPRLRRADGRAVPTFIDQCLRGAALTIHGDGSQTRSLCYVDDEIDGIYRLLLSDHTDPINIGNPEEVTVLQLAETIREAVGGSSEITFVERPIDDPEVRQPDITKARDLLGWEPHVSLDEGLARTIAWARDAWT